MLKLTLSGRQMLLDNDRYSLKPRCNGKKMAQPVFQNCESFFIGQPLDLVHRQPE